MLVDKHKIEKEQNAQLRNQVAQLLQSEQDQKLHIQQQDSTIQSLQVFPILHCLTIFISFFFQSSFLVF